MFLQVYADQEEMAAFFYKQFYPAVYRTACLYTRDAHLAEDVVQETFCKALQNFHQLNDQIKIKAWLLRIAANTAYDFLRLNARWPTPQDPDSLCQETKNRLLEEEVIAKETALVVWRAVAKMSPRLRQVLLLRYRENLSLEEISTALNVPAGTVKSRLHRARSKLFKRLSNFAP